MRDSEGLRARQDDLGDAEATVITNLLGPIRLIAALIPHLQAQSPATIINVSSGLRSCRWRCPTYSATKAALHSYTMSLRQQLRNTNVEVIELIPPAIQTFLMPGSATNPRYMPLAKYIAESVGLLQATPTPSEISVKRVKFLPLAAERGEMEQVFAALNGAAH